MAVIRSVLWIGPGQGLSENGVTAAPSLDVVWVRDVKEALALSPGSFEGAVLDARGAGDTLAQLAELTGHPAFPPVLLLMQRGAAPNASACEGAGAAEIIVVGDGDSDARGNVLEEILVRIDILAKTRGSERRAGSRPGLAACRQARFPEVIGSSRALRDVLGLVERASGSSATVLLTGETGTGKEVIARAIHQNSNRQRHAFVAINCAAFPDTLLESELFGYRKGAFTGAEKDKPGLFELAHGGTLFLDEIGETTAPLQAKLLRVLQEREVLPVGGSRPRGINVRVIAATNRTLRGESTKEALREDLYYRLAVFPIAIPPLRERCDDIVPLAEHFLLLHGGRDGKESCRLSQSAIHLLLSHRWPGNVRELENEMQRALALAEPGELITPSLLSDRVKEIIEPVCVGAERGESLREALDRIEAWLIRRCLEFNGGRRAATARKLGVTREGLYKKMKRLGIQ
ncbi:MAG: sigma 54-interacting transcriptional regulator [Deltaproteobacteria bacterium]|nr:sigma 54-interacting transcriptional regulator [Deltaproteobacteria bacterium]